MVVMLGGSSGSNMSSIWIWFGGSNGFSLSVGWLNAIQQNFYYLGVEIGHLAWCWFEYLELISVWLSSEVVNGCILELCHNCCFQA